MNNNTALAKIEKAQQVGALIFVDKEWGTDKTPLYKLEITEIFINRETECFNISGKFMPRREVVDRIGEASGIDFIFGISSSRTVDDDICGKRTVYTASAQGRRLMPDGSWRKSSKCDYDFDPVLRAMLDFDATELNSETKQKRRISSKGVPYGSTLARYILELQKVAMQRANTGARLRVIRELVGMPIAFEAKDLDKPLYLGRIIPNTDYILETPEGRIMATAKALDIDISALFGHKKPVPASSTLDKIPENNNDTAGLVDKIFLNRHKEEETVFENLTATLEKYMTFKEYLDITTKDGTNPYKLAQLELEDKDATEESRGKMIKRIRDFLVAKNVQGVA